MLANQQARYRRAAVTTDHRQAQICRGLKLGGILAMVMFISACQLLDMVKLSVVNATSVHEWTTPDQVTAVSFKLINNHIIVPVRINGSEPLGFVLDSGAAATVIFESHRSRSLDLSEGAQIALAGSGKGFESIASIVEDTKVSVGSINLLGQSIVSVPVNSVPFFDDLDEVYFDGIIGYDFFRRFVIDIDYEQMTVVFSEANDEALALESSDEEWQTLALDIQSSMPYLTTEVTTAQGRPVTVKLLVDTGSTGSFSLIPASHDGIDAPDEYYAQTSQGITGDSENRVAISSYFDLGDFRLTNLIGSYAISGDDSENGSNGILGNQVLSHFNIVFDYPNKRMSLRPNHRFDLPIAADRSGLRIQPHRLGGIIKGVAQGSAGDVIGLQAGDIITRFDSEAVTDATISELLRALASPQEAVQLCWLTSEQERCGPLKLAARY